MTTARSPARVVTADRRIVTQSGSIYCLHDGCIRKLNAGPHELLAGWVAFDEALILPACVLDPCAERGEVLHVKLSDGDVMATSPIVASTRT